MQPSPPAKFTAYQKMVIVLLAIVQFTVILDFMVMAPLGDILMKSMHLKAAQFASAVSVYAFSAGASGLLAAGFADKYDRKKLFLIFYIGFIAGTVMCATAATFPLLLAGRIITGLFAGVLGSVTMAIVADLFEFNQRGRVMGFVQMSFAVSQVLGIPVGLYLANQFNWHMPFLMIVALSVITTFFIYTSLKPVTAHLTKAHDVHALHHLKTTVTNKYYWLPFAATALLSIGGFMMMPFSTPFLINNIGIAQKQLPVIYVIIGVSSMILLPLIGKLSDRIGKWRTFILGTLVSAVMVAVYVNLGRIPVWEVIVINAFMFAGIMSRMIPSSALMTAIPKPEDRGAFMSINSSLQQVAGGVASVFAGVIIVQQANGVLLHFDTLGYICIAVMIGCAFLIYTVNQRVIRKMATEQTAQPQQVVNSETSLA